LYECPLTQGYLNDLVHSLGEDGHHMVSIVLGRYERNDVAEMSACARLQAAFDAWFFAWVNGCSAAGQSNALISPGHIAWPDT
jgi:hypothetical protein